MRERRKFLAYIFTCRDFLLDPEDSRSDVPGYFFPICHLIFLFWGEVSSNFGLCEVGGRMIVLPSSQYLFPLLMPQVLTLDAFRILSGFPTKTDFPMLR